MGIIDDIIDALLGSSGEGYMYKNSKNVKWWLHSKIGRGGTRIYYFDRKKEGSVPLPEGYEVVENKKTGMPVLRKVRPGVS